MRHVSFCVLFIILLSGCGGNRSISYIGSGYNPSYTGELSQIEMIRQLSSGESPSEKVMLDDSAAVMVIQSGQLRLTSVSQYAVELCG